MRPVVIPAYSGRSRELQPGDVIEGRYCVIRKLAQGGMGTVFLAEHVMIQRRVAVKLLKPELAADRAMVQRFMQEAAAAGTLGHPNIVESTDMGFTDEGVPYIVFEYLEGSLLTEEIRRIGALPVRRALAIARQIASALEAAHAAQIAHLDLKSDNVFLTSWGDIPDHAKLLDFGISRFLAADAEITQPDVVMGTPEFMAPEQVTCPDEVDGRADIYALGVMLYEMLTGHCPFENRNPLWVLDQVVNAPPPQIERPLPPALDYLLFDQLLVKPRDQRLQTMTEVKAALDAVIAELRGVPDALDSFDDRPTKPDNAQAAALAVSAMVRRSRAAQPGHEGSRS